MVMGPSMVERMGMAVESQMMMPCTPLCELMRFKVSSTSDMARRNGWPDEKKRGADRMASWVGCGWVCISFS